jgi:ribose 5-phosphate isomerase
VSILLQDQISKNVAEKRCPWQVVGLGMGHTATSLVKYKEKQERKVINRTNIAKHIANACNAVAEQNHFTSLITTTF